MRELPTVAVVTVPGRDGHQHCAVVDEDGNGWTSPAADGHFHQVVELEVRRWGGHRQPRQDNARYIERTRELLDHDHELSARRCDERHGAYGQHVPPKR